MRKIINSKIVILVSMLLFVFFNISCEYELKEKYFVDLQKPATVPAIYVDLNLKTDTIFFYWANSINLNIDAGNLKINKVIFYPDNKEVEGTNNSKTYSVVLHFFEAGIHKFKMTILTGSGTSSIADHLGAEGFLFGSREWTLVAKSFDTGIKMSAQIINNGLMLNWKKYDGNDFKR